MYCNYKFFRLPLQWIIFAQETFSRENSILKRPTVKWQDLTFILLLHMPLVLALKIPCQAKLCVTTQPLHPPLRLDLNFRLFFLFLFVYNHSPLFSCTCFLAFLQNIWLEQTDNSFNRIICFSPRFGIIYSVPESEVTGAQTQHGNVSVCTQGLR